MELTVFVILVFLAAFLGGIVTAIMGWVSTTEPFIGRKFLTSVVKSFIGAAVIAVAFDYSGTTSIILLLAAFLSGAGVDAGIKRVTDAIKSNSTPSAIETTTGTADNTSVDGSKTDGTNTAGS